MGKIRNEVSLSHSGMRLLESCPHAYWWRRYGGWGGWTATASPTTREAYRLTKLDSVWGIIGRAVENACNRAIALLRAGARSTPEDAYASATKELRRLWIESQGTGWRNDPKGVCRLREHEYDEAMPAGEVLTRRVRVCLENFFARHLERVAAIPAGRVLRLEPLEHFLFEGVTVFASPDLAYLDGDASLSIEDWKTGKRSAEHREQMALYALWALSRPGIAGVTVRLQYLLNGETDERPLGAPQLETARVRLRGAIEKVRERVDGGDLEANTTRMERWEMTPDVAECSRCDFRALCDGAKRANPAHVAAGAAVGVT